jgi:subtilase family serine protease
MHPFYTVKPLDGSGSPAYFLPYQVRHAYGFDRLSYDGSGQTIAIVDAFDDPYAARDLQIFNSYVLGRTDAVQFTKVAFTHQTDSGWAGEEALDIEWAHAIAPRAKILLVEAASDNSTDLLAAVDYAARQPGVVAVSMSWGGGEFTSEGANDSHFIAPPGHAGITFVASAGDDGAGAEWPAASSNVLAVGGTSLTTDMAGNYGRESAWSGSGGGISQVEAEPSWQRGVQNYNKRTIPDAAYDADPNTGVLVYNSFPDSNGDTGWFSFGGTSVGAPQWAALVALADQGRAAAGKPALANAEVVLYGLPSADFHDITSGGNGYNTRPGYDLVTGLGSPRADLIIPALINAVSPNLNPGTSVSKAGHSTAHTVPHAEPAAPDLADANAGLGLVLAELPAGRDVVWQGVGLSVWALDAAPSKQPVDGQDTSTELPASQHAIPADLDLTSLAGAGSKGNGITERSDGGAGGRMDAVL